MIIDLSDVRDFAIWAHANVLNPDGTLGQKRKYTFEPYIGHPLAVAGIVATATGVTPEMIAAALLHDTMEDTRNNPPQTRVTYEMIHSRFGQTVADYVLALSDMTTPADGNRDWRKSRERERLAAAPAQVQTIKYADLIHNTMSIVTHDHHFAYPYLGEKRALLAVADKGDARLYAWACQLAQDGIDQIEQARLNETLRRNGQVSAA